MEFTKKDMTVFKGVAILMMLLLHLFCRKEFDGLYETYIFIGDVPLIYYIALFGDACVPIYCFASGYGLYRSYTLTKSTYNYSNKKRLIKLIINFWIILFIFTWIGSFINPNVYPASLKEFFLNMLLLSNSYNGAWWFLQTYILLVLLSPLLLEITKKHNSFVIFIISVVIYLLTYIQRIKIVFNFGENEFINMFFDSMVLLGTSLFPFLVGSLFAKINVYTIFSKFMNGLKYKNVISLFIILFLILFHGIIESMIVAPFTAVLFICFFNVMDKKMYINNIFYLFGKHSTNIWLTHMFFYMTLFPSLIFAPKYPLLIFLWLICLCLTTSYLINLIYVLGINIADKKVCDKETIINSKY